MGSAKADRRPVIFFSNRSFPSPVSGKQESETERLLPRLLAAGLAVALQAVDVHADVGGFGRGVCERNGAVEGGAGFVVAAELHQEGAAHAEEMKIVRQPRRQGVDHVEPGLRSLYLGYRDRAIER